MTSDQSPNALSNGEPGELVTHHSSLVPRRLGLRPYLETWEAMKAFTATRTSDTSDEIWLLEHPAIYTYGVAGRREHFPRIDNGIPVIHVDRGGQITYHGPGQIVAYALLDLRRRAMTVRSLVRKLEQAVLDLLMDFGVRAERRDDAPGVYVNNAKVAALGLRVRRGCSYHGLSLNVDMDLQPFEAIDPCGFPDLRVTQLRSVGINESMPKLCERLISKLERRLSPGEEHA